MTKPVTIPNTFAGATTAIPLSQLDGDFSAVASAINDARTYSNYAADSGVVNAYAITLSGINIGPNRTFIGIPYLHTEIKSNLVPGRTNLRRTQ